jgi:geranylgeranyl pyrophosphate synthase
MTILAAPHLAYVERVEGRLSSAVGRSGAVSDAGGRTLQSGGKRLRPLLVYLSAPCDRREGDELVAAGCAVELVHMATLVHDDQLDAAPLRRGRPTVWSTDGAAVATATGDHLFARAFAELTGTGSLQAVTVLAESCLALARGEVLQRQQARLVDMPVEQYLERCRLKTGRLFSAATMLGGTLGGLEEAQVDALRRFGESLGLAFQIADDVLDCDGDPDTTGKPLGTDLLDGTMSLPLLLAARRDSQVREVLTRSAAPEDVLPTLARVATSGALEECRAEARRHVTAAEHALGQLDGRVESELLRAALRSAIDRER